MSVNLDHAMDSSTGYPPKTKQPKKKKIDEFGFIRFLHFCASECTIQKVKRKFTEREKIFSNPLSYWGLVPKIYK